MSDTAHQIGAVRAEIYGGGTATVTPEHGLRIFTEDGREIAAVRPSKSLARHLADELRRHMAQWPD